jgi:predicted ArsR family transcriptional regulator
MDRALSALHDLTRRDILFRFYSDPTPKTAVEVARTAGIHRSVAFDHLERLVSLGYLETELRRGFPGKPAKLYRLAQGPITVSHPPRQFGLLAHQLALALEGFGQAGLSAAHAAGRRLAASLEPATDGASLAACLKPLEALGATYDLTVPGQVVMTNCLFHESCLKSTAVRRFQAGLLEALIAPARPGFRVEETGITEPGLCPYVMVDAAGVRRYSGAADRATG